MNCLINLIPIKKGGGQQVASNFVMQLQEMQDLTPIFLVTKDTYIHYKLIESGARNVYIITPGLKGRLMFEWFKLKGIIRSHNIDIIYTLFGPGLHNKGVKSVTGCAYSNIFFPEIPFWKTYSLLKRVRLWLVDKYRLSSILRSDAIIFENAAMMERAYSLFQFPYNKMKLILPSISEYAESKIGREFNNRLNAIDAKDFNILMLTGWHKNKNIEIVPYVLKELKEKGFADVKFVVTVPNRHLESIKLKKVADELNVGDNIIFFDTVQPHEVPALFEKIEAVALLSLLESFSNNIIEAWYFNKPLFISDEEWSRAICKDAAIYVDRNDSRHIASVIVNYRNNVMQQKEIMLKATNIIKEYPNPKKKVEDQVKFLKEILNA